MDAERFAAALARLDTDIETIREGNDNRPHVLAGALYSIRSALLAIAENPSDNAAQ